jgi:hypothetical protein
MCSKSTFATRQTTIVHCAVVLAKGSLTHPCYSVQLKTGVLINPQSDEQAPSHHSAATSAEV